MWVYDVCQGLNPDIHHHKLTLHYTLAFYLRPRHTSSQTYITLHTYVLSQDVGKDLNPDQHMINHDYSLQIYATLGNFIEIAYDCLSNM